MKTFVTVVRWAGTCRLLASFHRPFLLFQVIRVNFSYSLRPFSSNTASPSLVVESANIHFPMEAIHKVNSSMVVSPCRYSTSCANLLHILPLASLRHQCSTASLSLSLAFPLRSREWSPSRRRPVQSGRMTAQDSGTRVASTVPLSPVGERRSHLWLPTALRGRAKIISRLSPDALCQILL